MLFNLLSPYLNKIIDRRFIKLFQVETVLLSNLRGTNLYKKRDVFIYYIFK